VQLVNCISLWTLWIWEELCGRALVNSHESFKSFKWWNCISVLLQCGRAVRKGSFLLISVVQVVQLVKLHISTLTYSTVELWGKGSFQLVRVFQVVQVVKLHISTLTYSTVELCRKGVLSIRTSRTSRATGESAYHYWDLQPVKLWGRGSFQLVRLVHVVQVLDSFTRLQ